MIGDTVGTRVKAVVEDDLFVGDLSFDADELCGGTRDTSNLFPGLIRFGRRVDADDGMCIVSQGKTGDHAGLRATGHRTHEDVVEGNAELDLLLLDLLRPSGKAEAAEGMVRRPRRDGVGLAPTIFDLEDRLFPALFESDAEARVHETNVSPHQATEQDVAYAVVGHVGPLHPTLLDEDALHPGLGRRRGHLSRVVRLHASD